MATYNKEKNYGGDATIVVTQVKSSTHAKPKSRGTIRALGLRGVGDSNLLPDRPEIRGMIARVPHLVEVADGDATAGSAPSAKKPAAKKPAAKKAPAAKAAAKKQES